MSADALSGWLAADPVGGVTGTHSYIDLYNDDADSAMPLLEADTGYHSPSASASLALPLPVPGNSSIVIQQTTHVERTVRTEIRSAPTHPPPSSSSAKPRTNAEAAANATSTVTAGLNGVGHSAANGPQCLSSSPQPTGLAAIPPVTTDTVTRASSSSSSAVHVFVPSSSASNSLSTMHPPPPEFIPPPATRPSSTAASSSSPLSSLTLSLSSLSSPSSSSSTATVVQSASSDPTDEFLEDEGLRPQFSSWTAVSSPMPSQSYSAYLDTCERTLPPSALAALQKCAPGDPTAENTHTDPFPLLRAPQQGAQHPFTVLQRADSLHGLVQHKLVASRPIREKEVIGFIAGHLETEHEAEREGVDKLHPSHIHINRGYLHRYLGYVHSYALVLSLKRFHNSLHHIRDPALFLSDSDEKRPEVSAYNVHVDLVLDPERRVPVVVAFAWVDIHEGQELTAYLGLGVWYSRDHQRLFLASRVNHWYHRKVADMEKLLDEHKINFQKQTNTHASNAKGKKSSASTSPSASKQTEEKAAEKGGSGAATESKSDPPGPVLSAADEWRFLGDEEKREETIMKWHREQVGLNRGMEKVELWRVFALSQCAYIPKVFLGKSVSSHTRAALQQLPDFIPAHVAIGNYAVDVDPAAIRQLVEKGHDETLCEVREVTSLISPVRYYSAPWHPAFCVVARKLIKKGSFVFTYSGELEQEIRNRDSVYVYDVQADNIRAHWPSCPADLPDMVIDAEKYGGVARFVNDSRYRLHEGLAEGEAENLNHTFVFVDKCIHLCFYVTRDVKAKEELVSTYGDEFWSVCTGQMLIQHRKYYNHVAHYHQQLSNLLHKHKLPLPEPPSYLLELHPHFQRKIALYPDEPHPTDTLATEEEWEVEQILSKGRMSGETHYLVKWLGFDDAYNSWVKKSEMACTQLIQQFEQQLKQESGAVRAGGSGKKQRKPAKGKRGQRKSHSRTLERVNGEARGDGKEDTEAASSSSSGTSGTDSDEDKRKKIPRKRKRKQANDRRAANDGSGTAEADNSASGRKNDRESKEGTRAPKPTPQQRQATKQKIREALQDARAKKSDERRAAGLSSPAAAQLDDDSTDTEDDVGPGEREQGDDSLVRAPLLPPITTEDRMALE